MHRFTLLFALLQTLSILQAQVGGSATYAYLDLAPSARISALGGFAISAFDADPNLGYQNPALYQAEMHQKISFSHAFYPAGIQFGSVSYAQSLKNDEFTVGGGILYRLYGAFERTDAAGNSLGRFSASEYSMHGGGSWRSDKISYGANLKLLYSQLENYWSLGAAVDLAATYADTASQFTASIVFQNAGFQLKPYTNGNQELLPFDIQIGVSKRLKYLPLQLSVTIHDLHRPDIRYDDPNAVDNTQIFFGEEEEGERKYIADKIFSHIAFSGEFFFGPSFRVRLGYDHQRRSELGVDTRQGISGFSAGFGLRIRRFHIDYAHAVHHIGGRNNMITLTTDFAEFKSGK
jgi:hypothetical protein